MKKIGDVTMVGIAGASGSGKTTFVRRLSEVIGKENISLLHHDSYYRDRSGLSPQERAGLNYDHPEALETGLLVEHLELLSRGRQVEVPSYDFTTHCRRKETVTVQARPIVLVEGIMVLSEPLLREYFDLRIFIELEEDLLLARRISRDVSERGRTVEASLEQYQATTRPMMHHWVLPAREHADLIVAGDRFLDDASVLIIGLGLRSLVGRRSGDPGENN